MSEHSAATPIIVRRVKRRIHAHHGGAWKVAYADFVTAMMAFFLVMWLIGVGTREQRAAISEYFKNPSMTPGTATIAPPGRIGPGGASDSMIQLGGAMDMSHGPGKDKHGVETAKGENKPDSKQAEQQARRQERAQLEQLMQQLHAAIEKSQALAPFKDQLLLDITPEGLRIQIVDKLNRPMFDLGSAKLKPYTIAILHELGRFINRVPNKISISGHTDDAPYSSDHAYSNWELSADRGNAARRALIDGGLADGKVARVVGLAAAVPFDKADPRDPSNRRISIIVMTRKAERAALSQESFGKDPDDGGSAQAPTASAGKPASPLPPLPPVIKPAGRDGAGVQPAAGRPASP
ncbi:MAG: flagellar motor protein MotB [Xanthomonadaceae bacterium]|nr:flagellar motor protein MotB [Xanthomonadaceae bacterium]